MSEDYVRSTHLDYEHLSLYISPDTAMCAKLSCGGVIETALAVMDPLSGVANAFALVRPPGHHAEPDHAMGFCFFNNVAVAARVVQEKMARKVKTVIIDWCVPRAPLASSRAPALTVLRIAADPSRGLHRLLPGTCTMVRLHSFGSGVLAPT